MELGRLKGMADVYGVEIAYWQKIETSARKLLGAFGYGEIKTPLLEKTELFQRGIGEETDIVQKEMYTFRDRADRSLTVRPEGTASVVRAFVEDELFRVERPTRFFYYGPMYRYERPQKGRMRQFHQLGAELFGLASAEAEAEMIAMLSLFLQDLGLRDIAVKLNSVGCPACRPGYVATLTGYFSAHVQNLCENCRQRLTRNPLRLLDCKEEGCQPIKGGAPLISHSLCEGCCSHYDQVQGLLADLQVPFACDPLLVRGLDYYTKTVFEVAAAGLGAQNALLGGGRYDNLVEQFGGPSTPAVGFGMGIERLVLLLKELTPIDVPPVEYYGIALDESARRRLFGVIHQLRLQGHRAELDFKGGGLKGQLKRADKTGAMKALILGADELAAGTVVVRDLKNSTQEVVVLSTLNA